MADNQTSKRIHRAVGSRALVVVSLALLGSSVLSVPPALADPVAECQAITNSQVETSQCLTDTLNTVQYVMNLELTQAQEKADSLDQVTGRVVARPALDQSQAEFLKYRDVNCNVRSAFAAGASGSGQFVTSCAITMTRARTAELSELASGG